MVETSSPKITVDARTETGVIALGILAGIGAAYYTGKTGNWEPLMVISLGLAFSVLFVTSE